MKELTKHIEALLLDNDCVILPNFGGFITNHASAQWLEEENTFLPPYRTIGFNPQLKINDGLLVQSYMQTHDATFPEALKMVEKAIDRLSEFLYKEGVVELRGIGRLCRTYTGDFYFEPTEDGVLTPTLYGLSSVEVVPVEQLITQRKELEKVEVLAPTAYVEISKEEKTEVQRDDKTITIKFGREWITNIAATAAAIVMFFLWSTPVDNTYVEEENFASLGSVSVFEQVKDESLLTTLFEIPMEKPAEAVKLVAPVAVEKPAEAVKPVAPIVVGKSAEIVKPVTPAEVKKTPVARFNIIVASVASEIDAEKAIKDFAEKGHPGAFLIKGSGRFRIALKAFEAESEAYRVANELKRDELFKHAWVLKTKR